MLERGDAVDWARFREILEVPDLGMVVKIESREKKRECA
jgi:hypothetical protein